MEFKQIYALKGQLSLEETGVSDGEITVLHSADNTEPELGNWFAEFFYGRSEFTLVNHVAGVWYTADSSEEAEAMIKEDILSVVQGSDCVNLYNMDLEILSKVDDEETQALLDLLDEESDDE